jgi:beta-galactosidase-like protein
MYKLLLFQKSIIQLVPGFDGKGIDLNGHDQWVEVYRDEALEVEGDHLTLILQVFPRSLNSSAGALLTKGDWQFGVHQIRNDSLEFYITTMQKKKVQIALPEMWQIKKSAQAISTKLLSAERGEIEIKNRYLFTNLNELQTEWILQADGEILQKGVLPLNLDPQKTAVVVIPYIKPEIKGGVEYRLLISFHQKGKTLWAEPGFEIAWDQHDLPWFKHIKNVEKTFSSSLTTKEEKDKLM